MTSETLTGAVMPTQGLISTLPSIRGLDSQSMGPWEQGGPNGLAACIAGRLPWSQKCLGIRSENYHLLGLIRAQRRPSRVSRACRTIGMRRLVELWGICEWTGGSFRTVHKGSTVGWVDGVDV